MNKSGRVMLSVLVLTYNQVEYIEKAIDSVLKQNTEYSYEIVIHDDLSTDGTREIVQNYQEKYPDKIVLILEEENVYSKDIAKLRRKCFEYLKGKYMCILEGDDYWVDKYKIEKQVSLLESNKEFAGVAHASKHMLEGEKEWISPVDRKTGYYEIEELIDWNNVFHTASFMFRTDYYLLMPRTIQNIINGDWCNAVWLAAKGKIYYVDEVMTVHRLFTKGSYSKQFFGECANYKKIYTDRERNCHLLDAALNYKYHESFQRSMYRRWFNFYYENEDYKNAFSYRRAIFYEKMSIYIYLRCFLFAFFPFLSDIIKRARNTAKAVLVKRSQ